MGFEAKKTLADAWEITNQNKKYLFWYGFIPSFFVIGVGAVLIYFQVILFQNSSFFTKDTKGMLDIIKPIWEWTLSSEISKTTILLTIIAVFVSSYILPVFSEGAIIMMTKNKDENNRMHNGFGKGLSCFLPLFEFSMLQNTIKPYSIAFEFLFFLRMFGKGSEVFLKPIFFIVITLGSIALFFFSFVRQYIALKKEQVGDAILSSLKLVSRFFLETFKILLLLLFIEIRTLFNVLIIFLLPFVLISIGGIWAEGIIGSIAQGVIGLLLLSLASSISGILFVYKNIAWTLTFLQLTSIKELEENS